MDPRTGEIYAMASHADLRPQRLQARDVGGGAEPADRRRVRARLDGQGDDGVGGDRRGDLHAEVDVPPPADHHGRRPGDPRGARPRGRSITRWRRSSPTPATSVRSSSARRSARRGSRNYFQRFGLLERTGVDFPGEAKGWMPPVDEWSSSTIGNVPFGQGVSVNALQLARAVAAIGNSGRLVTPHFLKTVRGDASVKMAWPTSQAISPEDAPRR